MILALNNIIRHNLSFYVLMTLALGAVLFTNPFLKYPYDMFHHLLHIDRFDTVTEIPNGRWIWHFLWAKFFLIIDIPTSEIFLRAKIIHIIQTYIAFFSLYYFSNVILRTLFIDIFPSTLKYLSLWSTVIWLTIFATYSVQYQLVWNLWYSVNYQVTLPLFWYITALTLVLFLEDTSFKIKIFFTLQILLISRFILQAHSMEFLYYLMYLSIFLLIYIDKFFTFIKKYYMPIFLLIGSIIYFAKNYQPEHSKILNYLTIEKLPSLYEKILQEGNVLLSGYNRASASINELMSVILVLSLFLALHILWLYLTKRVLKINIRVLGFIYITSLFVLIPLYQFSGGLFAVITKTMVVNRFYYSSSLFLIIPIVTYYFYSKIFSIKENLLYLNITILFILFSTWLYSRYDIGHKQNYYKNISSIKNSFYGNKLSFNLSNEQIRIVGLHLKKYENIHLSKKEKIYYARADIAFVIKYVYRKKIYWESRRANPKYMLKYKQHENLNLYPILFEIPQGFPVYTPYK